jgi:hypothetical protein
MSQNHGTTATGTGDIVAVCNVTDIRSAWASMKRLR